MPAQIVRPMSPRLVRRHGVEIAEDRLILVPDREEALGRALGESRRPSA
jgi:hypothetical protein